EHYRAALTISEEIGNRSGIASSYGQLGILRTEQQRPAEGVAHMLEALVLQLEIGRPPDTTLYWLGRQRALLGDDDFRSILNDLVTDDVAAAIMNAAPPQNEPPPHEESTG
ncbi:hypothetical protein, partial [Streptomyces chartreusis]